MRKDFLDKIQKALTTKLKKEKKSINFIEIKTLVKPLIKNTSRNMNREAPDLEEIVAIYTPPDKGLVPGTRKEPLK